VLITEDFLIGADPENNILRVTVMTVEMEDRRFPVLEKRLDSGTVSPGDRVESGYLLDQAIIVRSGDARTQLVNGLDNVSFFNP
jgi:hypothetical protein